MPGYLEKFTRNVGVVFWSCEIVCLPCSICLAYGRKLKHPWVWKQSCTLTACAWY